MYAGGIPLAVSAPTTDAGRRADDHLGLGRVPAGLVLQRLQGADQPRSAYDASGTEHETNAHERAVPGLTNRQPECAERHAPRSRVSSPRVRPTSSDTLRTASSVPAT